MNTRLVRRRPAALALAAALWAAPAALAAPLLESPAPAADSAAAPTPAPADDAWFGPFKHKATFGLAGRASSAGADTQDWSVQLGTRSDNRRHRLQAEAGWFLSLLEGDVRRSTAFGKLTHDWKLPGSAWSLFVRGESAFNRFSAWETRLAAYGGVACEFLDTEAWEVTGRLGLGERYDFGDVDRFTPEAMFGGSALGWKIAERQKLALEVLLYPALDGSGEWRASGSAEWSLGLAGSGRTSLRLGVRDEYESARTGADERAHDLYYYMGVGFDV